MLSYVLSKDEIVVWIENGKIVKRDLLRCPLALRKGDSIDNWLNDRAIDSHRINSRLLKKILRISDKSDKEVVLYNNAVTITDNFWVKDENSDLKWKDVRFSNNYFDKLALLGDPDSFKLKPSRNPELTNIGSYEKCWRLENNCWVMYKKETINQRFSEFLIYRLGLKLGFNMAKYELCDIGTKTYDFTLNNKYNFEPIKSIMNDNEEYNDVFNVLVSINKEIAKDYLKMIYLDTLCFNMDRHNFNYGLLRDSDSGEIIMLAPNFDNNIALILNDKYPTVDGGVSFLRELFADFLFNNKVAKEMYEELNIRKLNKEEIEEVLYSINLDVDKEKILNFIIDNQNELLNIL